MSAVCAARFSGLLKTASSRTDDSWEVEGGAGSGQAGRGGEGTTGGGHY